MSIKVIEKKKLKLTSLLLILLFIILLCLSIYFLIKLPIKNIVIKNNDYLSDDYIIETADIKDYPSFFLTSKHKISKKLSKSVFINKVKVNKKYGFILEIDVKENKILYLDETKQKYILNDGSETEKDTYFSVPRLLNYVPDNKLPKFLKGMSSLDKTVISKISDIEYLPTEYDKERFAMYMDDGNKVYVTLTKFDTMNHYNEVVKQLDNHKGVLNLDSGNHFEIKE